MFNMDNLNKIDEWAEVPYMWFLCDILTNVARVAVCLASPNYPRKLETIITKLSYQLLSDESLDSHTVGGVHMFAMSLNGLVDSIYTKLMDLKEFREWNLTSFELEAFKQNLYYEFGSKIIENYVFHGNAKG